ncbi:MAG: hypothetical protein K0Q67_3264 [Cellvibrio sp.]|jgi:hypothetical protein|nr:hypothetical protein [Cellvibrio sp.]
MTLFCSVDLHLELLCRDNVFMGILVQLFVQIETNISGLLIYVHCQC